MRTTTLRPLAFLLPFALLSTAHAQTVQWMHQGGISGAGRGIASDAQDNCYVTGTVGSPALFDQDTTASHFADAFLAKYDEAGTIQWVRTGGNELIDQANDIAVDAEGNAYITGFFRTNIPFPTVTFSGSVVEGLGSSDLFVAKYDADGNLLWLRTGGGTDAEEGRGVALLPNGNVVVSGYFQGTAVFGDDTLTSMGLSDVLLLSYDPAGNLLWSARGGGPGDDMANKLAPCANGDVAMAGLYQQTAVFGSDVFTSVGLSNIFLARYTGAGSEVWAVSAGSTVNFASDQAMDVKAAPNGDLVLCGEIAGPAQFEGNTVTPNGGIDLFVARYDGAGNVLWVHHAGGPQVDHAYGLAVDANGNAYVTGQADDGASTVFDSITLEPFGNEAVFLAKYDAAGAIQWVKRYAPGLGGAVTIADANCLYFTGGASGIVGQPAFDNVPWQFVDRAIFTARFCEDEATGTAEVHAKTAVFSVYPNPATDVVTLAGIVPNTVVTLRDAQGRVVQQQRAGTVLDVSALAVGMYTVQAGNERLGLMVW